MSVCIIDYNAGNTASVVNALARLGVQASISSDEAELKRAEKVIFPGVGHASSAMAFLRERRLDETIRSLRQPFLGICLGLQLLCTHSEEGDTHGLGIFSEVVRGLKDAPKIPHMGWNTVEPGSAFRILMPDSGYYYFVHSFAAQRGENTAGITTYGETFSAALVRDNFFAVQFHPEKSGVNGERFLRRFLDL